MNKELEFHTIILSYADAQEILKIARIAKKENPYPEARFHISTTIEQLEMVRNYEYPPFGGKQIHFSEKEWWFFEPLLELYKHTDTIAIMPRDRKLGKKKLAKISKEMSKNG